MRSEAKGWYEAERGLALGAVLMLGGVIGGRGDELSGSVGAAGQSPAGGFSLPDASRELELE